HLPALARARALALAGVRRRLDEEHVPAGRGVREPGRDTRIRSPLPHLTAEAARPEPRTHAPLVDAHLPGRLPFGDLARGLPAQVGDPPLEISHARLARVLADHEPQRLVA